MKWLGIAAIYLLAPAYVILMVRTSQAIEWSVVAFIVAMGTFVLLYATVWKRFTEDTAENRDTAVKVIKKAIRGGARLDE